MRRIYKIVVKGCYMALVLLLVTGMSSVTIQAKSNSYQFSCKGVTANMHDKAKKIIIIAGKPVTKKVTKSCAYKGKDRIYKYKDFILYTYSKTDKGEEFINGITLLTSSVMTKEGIKIGSTLDDLIKTYGKGKEKFGIYTYKKGKSKLQIEVTDEKVTNIRYIATKL